MVDAGADAHSFQRALPAETARGSDLSPCVLDGAHGLGRGFMRLGTVSQDRPRLRRRLTDTPPRRARASRQTRGRLWTTAGPPGRQRARSGSRSSGGATATFERVYGRGTDRTPYAGPLQLFDGALSPDESSVRPSSELRDPVRPLALSPVLVGLELIAALSTRTRPGHLSQLGLVVLEAEA